MMLELFITSLLVLNPNHELNRYSELRAEVAGYSNLAGKKYDIYPSLILYQAYRESTFRRKVKAKDRPSVGYAQAHGRSKKLCEKNGYNVTTRRGGIYCIALLIDDGIKECGTLEKAMIYYACGNCRGTPRTQKLIKWRLQEWRRRWRATK